MDNKFAHEVIQGLDAIKPLQEISYKAHKLKGDSIIQNPLAFAKEAVKHFYGMETGSLLIDLDFEKRHTEYFYKHLVENSKGEGFTELEEVRKASKAYAEAIARYTTAKANESFKEYLEEVEGRI